MSNQLTNVMIVGVGGQGVILASDILCEVALRSGLDVKKSEVHGMSQRGGVVSSHVRFGEKVFSPLISNGDSDAILAFESSEALRFAHEVKNDGLLIVSTKKIKPPSGGGRKVAVYPEDAINDARGVCAGKVISIEAESIAMELSNPRLSNTILLGALSNGLMIKEDIWHQTITDMVPPKTVDINLKAFARGRKLGQ